MVVLVATAAFEIRWVNDWEGYVYGELAIHNYVNRRGNIYICILGDVVWEERALDRKRQMLSESQMSCFALQLNLREMR